MIGDPLGTGDYLRVLLRIACSIAWTIERPITPGALITIKQLFYFLFSRGITYRRDMDIVRGARNKLCTLTRVRVSAIINERSDMSTMVDVALSYGNLQ